MKQNTLLIELHYLPCIQYFAYLSSYQKVLIDLNDIYIRQTFRNRCRINGANCIEDLIVPVRKVSAGKTKSREVEIDYEQKWLNKHTRAIQSAYGKAPFFDYYGEEILDIYNKKPCLLSELNKELLTKCLEILELDIDIHFTEEIMEEDDKVLIDAKNEINPKKTICEDGCFKSINYFQVFGNNFAKNLSIVDLIFCEGPLARDIIQKSSAFE